MPLVTLWMAYGFTRLTLYSMLSVIFSNYHYIYIYYSFSILWPYCYIIIHCFLNMIDVKSGLINTAQLNNLYWSPWMNNLFCFALINQPPVLKSHLFDPKFVISNSLSFSSCLINLRTHHCYTEGLS